MEHLWLRESQDTYEVLNKKHDKGYKYLLSAKKIFVELLRSFVKQGWVEKIEESNITRVDKSFILQDFKDKEADLVYWVKLSEQDVIFYVLMEMQSTVDFQMPYRLLVYMVEIWREFIKDLDEGQEKVKKFRLPAIVPIVLYNGKNRWTACRSYKEYLTGNELFGEHLVDFTYILIDVNRYTEEELLDLSNTIGAAFLIDQNSDFNCLFERLKKVVEILKKLDAHDSNIFKNWFANIVKRSGQNNFEVIEKLILESKEVESMVYNFELAIKDEFIKREQKGIEKGMAEGEQKGLLKGKIETAKTGLLEGLSVELIKKLTGLEFETIEELKKEISH